MHRQQEFKSEEMVVAKRNNSEIACIVMGFHWNGDNWEYLVYSAELPHLTFVFTGDRIRHLNKDDIN